MPEEKRAHSMNSVTVHNWPLRVTVEFPAVVDQAAFEKIRAALGNAARELEGIQAEAAKKLRNGDNA